jgi:predicted HTH domain antitoxin
MSTVAIELDEALAALLRETSQPIQLAASEMIVLELYRRGGISSGNAGELLGMPRLDFIRHASELGIPAIDMTAEEWEQEKAAVTAWPEWGSARNRN